MKLCRHCRKALASCLVYEMLHGHRLWGCKGYIHWHSTEHDCGNNATRAEWISG